MITMDQRDLKVLDILSGKISIEVSEAMMNSKNSAQAGEDCNTATMKALKDAYSLGRASIMNDTAEKINIVRRIKRDLEEIKVSFTPTHFVREGVRRIQEILKAYQS